MPFIPAHGDGETYCAPAGWEPVPDGLIASDVAASVSGMTYRDASLVLSDHEPRDSVPLAYRVPWRVDRSAAPTFRIINASADKLRGVTLDLTGEAVMIATSRAVVLPGEWVSATIIGRNLALNTILLVRWFNAEGDEYLWRISF